MNNQEARYLTIENARLVFRNFSGSPDKYHPEGAPPSFGVILDEESVNVSKIEADDWYVRRMNPRPDDPSQYRQPWLKVNLKMDGKNPPTVELIKNGRRFKMTKATIDQLDWTRIQFADLQVRSYRYDPKKPMSAWLVDLRVVAQDSDLDSKYSNIPYANDDDKEEIPFQ